MADVLLLTASAVIIAVLILLLTFLIRSNKKSDAAESAQQIPRPGAVRNVQDGEVQPPRRVGARNVRARMRTQMRINASRQNQDDEDEELDELADQIALPDGKIGAKKRKKLEMKAEKRVNRETELEEREERKRRQELKDEARKKEEGKQKMEDAQREEEERLAREEKERKEHEEYLLMKESFAIEQEGFDETEAEKESQSLLEEFIAYIKTQKVVILEELAAHFNLKTQEAINRIHSLLEEEKIMGVIDDRGKFIYISIDELKEVAKFIRQRGRVSKAELAESSNNLINVQTQAVVS